MRRVIPSDMAPVLRQDTAATKFRKHQMDRLVYPVRPTKRSRHGSLLDLAFLVLHMLARDGVKLADAHLLRHRPGVFLGHVEVAGPRGGIQADLDCGGFRHGSSPAPPGRTARCEILVKPAFYRRRPASQPAKAGKSMRGRPVSRILFLDGDPRPQTTIPLRRALPRGSSCQPGSLGRKRPCARRRARSLFGIAPGGACHADAVASPPVGPYPTVSPWPCPRAWWFVFCGAFRQVALPGRYPAPVLRRVRTFLSSGSPRASGRPAFRARPT